MSDITSVIAKMKSFHARIGVSIGEIKEAEKNLRVNFSNEYKECLIQFGQFSIYGHEFMGITKISRLNIVEITKLERQNNKLISQDLYVIEQTHFDDIVIWQNKQGEIFKSVLMGKPEKIADSLLSYIELDNNEEE